MISLFTSQIGGAFQHAGRYTGTLSTFIAVDSSLLCVYPLLIMYRPMMRVYKIGRAENARENMGNWGTRRNLDGCVRRYIICYFKQEETEERNKK